MLSRQQSTPPLFPYTTLFRSYVTGAPDPTARRSANVDLPLRAPPSSTTRLTGRGSRAPARRRAPTLAHRRRDRKSTRLNSSHITISYADFSLQKQKNQDTQQS